MKQTNRDTTIESTFMGPHFTLESGRKAGIEVVKAAAPGGLIEQSLSETIVYPESLAYKLRENAKYIGVAAGVVGVYLLVKSLRK